MYRHVSQNICDLRECYADPQQGGLRYCMCVLSGCIAALTRALTITVLGNITGLPVFREKYGRYAGAEAGYQLDPQWQSAIGQAPTIGNILYGDDERHSP